MSVIPTLREWMSAQITGKRKQEVAYGTLKRDEITWRTRVYLSDLGRMPLDTITVDHCQAFLDAQRKLVPLKDEDGRTVWEDEDGHRIDRTIHRTPSAVKGARMVYVKSEEHLDRDTLKRIGATLCIYFELARRKPYRYIKLNPMNGEAETVDYPREMKDERPRKSMTPPQAAKLQTNLLSFLTKLREQGARFEAMVLTARDTGFRPGELCGTLRSSVMREERDGEVIHYIRTENARRRAAKGSEDAATKTGKVREVPITEETYDRIMALPDRSKYAFTTESGRPMSRDNFTRDFGKFAEEIGMPELTPQRLRHTYISLMLKARVDVKAVQKMVGHTTPRMIMEVYAETFDDSMLEAPQRMANLLKLYEDDGKKKGKAAG